MRVCIERDILKLFTEYDSRFSILFINMFFPDEITDN